MDYFSGIRGQDKSIEIIKKAVCEEKLSHAYLFVGPAGVGKMMAACAFASSILAKGDAQADLLLGENMHPDLLIIEREEAKTLIGIEQITRQMEPWLAKKPFRSTFRVVIIRDAQMLSEPAGNSLLKILEDPPPYAVLIIIADAANLMETILSRCQAVRFYPLSEHIISECLVEKGVDEESAAWAAQMGQGSMGRAWKFIAEEGLAPLLDQARQVVQELSTKNPGCVFKAVDKMEKYPEMMGALLETVLRDVCVYRLTRQSDLLVYKENMDVVERLPWIEPGKIMGRLKKISRLRQFYSKNVNPLLININIAFAVHEALQ